MPVTPQPLSRDDIEHGTDTLVESKRRWCREQASLWRRIPEAALRADGVSGYNDRHSYAYQHGFWQLYSSTSGGYYHVYVDLSSGELVNASSVGDFLQQKIGAPVRCRDEDVLALSLDELDAALTLSQLEAHAARAPFSGYDLEQVESWREEKRLQLPDVWSPRTVADDYEQARQIQQPAKEAATVGPLSRPSSLSQS